MSKFLSKKERKELLNELKLERYSKYSDRLKTILLLDEGKDYKSIADRATKCPLLPSSICDVTLEPWDFLGIIHK